MKEPFTKEDLWQFASEIIREVTKINNPLTNQSEVISDEWLKSKAVRKILDISAGSLRNLRITCKLRYKKVMGSYYYNKADLLGLFNDVS
ncbi:DNA-binding protein [Flavobacterium psychrotrophum]|jgi:hypothetical protein|uniref:DNA-binding protein n=1 Tax=Flavobacterium psychrotrophum TaxID=2294119 RepID=UPI000E319067|nr:DNA-binding protein [Flavobacterium psychrotrophum]